MLILEHIRQLVKACHPRSLEEADEFRANINPIKFGNVNNWSAANTYTLASYQVPRDTFTIVLRVECYTVNLTSGAADYGMFEPPPPGVAFWVYFPPDGLGINAYNVTSPLMPTHLALDADELLIFQGGYDIALLGTLSATADGATRRVRTLVYSYNCGPAIVDRIGSAKMLITQ